MEAFFSSPILQALAALWLATGFVKGIVVAQQMPALMGWYVFYKTNDTEKSTTWQTDKALVVCMVLMGIVATALFTVLGPLLILVGRERTMRYFTAYGDPYIADIAATHLKVPTGVDPYEWETWDDYQERIGHDPKKVAEAIVIAQPKLPESIEKVMHNANELRNMDREDIDVAEDEEFRD